MGKIIEIESAHNLAMKETLDWIINVVGKFKSDPKYDPDDPEAQELLTIIKDHEVER